MSQDESSATAPSSIQLGALLKTEADLKAWYIKTNPILRSIGLSCPKTLYKEMQRDLRDFDSTVAIIPLVDDEDEWMRQTEEFFESSKSKPGQYTCRLRELCPGAPIYVATSTSARE